MNQASEAKLNLRNQERRLLERYLMSGHRPWSEIKRAKEGIIAPEIVDALIATLKRDDLCDETDGEHHTDEFVNIFLIAFDTELRARKAVAQNVRGVIGCDGQHERGSTLGCEDPEHCEIALERETF